MVFILQIFKITYFKENSRNFEDSQREMMIPPQPQSSQTEDSRFQKERDVKFNLDEKEEKLGKKENNFEKKRNLLKSNTVEMRDQISYIRKLKGTEDEIDLLKEEKQTRINYLNVSSTIKLNKFLKYLKKKKLEKNEKTSKR